MTNCSLSPEETVRRQLARAKARERGLIPPEPTDSERAEELARCAADPVYWCNTYCRTYDPRLPEPFIPFRLFPRQEEFLRWLGERERNQENGLAEKSRDVGFTWLCCTYALHGWLFRPGFACGFGSRKLQLVDRLGDPSCIFEKIRILLRNLPEWQLPAGFKWSDHDNQCRLLNPFTGAVITGEGGDDIGRGGRATIYFVDEAAHIEHPQRVDAALSATTRCRIDVSTPNGPGNPFAKKRHSGKVPVFTFHWRDDPRKDDAWYAAEKERLGDPVIVAQEIDIDYSASVEGICIPAIWVRAAVGLIEKIGQCRLTRCVAGLDVAEYGRARTVLIGRRGPVVLAPVDWGQCNTTETAHRARDHAEKIGATILYYDAVGVGAGVRGSFETADHRLPFTAHALLSGESPTETLWPDGRTSKERFLNLRAELWWILRRRFEKTFEFVEEGRPHPVEELISLPDCPQLIAELSMPLYARTESGKIKIESKDAMQKRGVASPNFADALVYAFAPFEPAAAAEIAELADDWYDFDTESSILPWE